jgi:hypothetical protein
VAHYILNSVAAEAGQRTALRERVAEFLRVGMWDIDADEPHRDALAAGDLVLIYLGAPEREFIGRAELASVPGAASSGVLLTHVEQWDPPVPMNIVLSRLDPAAKARADFDAGVVLITAHEYETVLAVAAERASLTG